MSGRKLMWVAWPSFLAACVLQLLVFAVVDPLEVHALQAVAHVSRQAVYAGAFFVFWAVALFSSALTAWLGLAQAPRAD
jgi:hypothetical protein